VREQSIVVLVAGIVLAALAADGVKPPVGKELPIKQQWSGRTTLEKAKIAPKAKYASGPVELARLWKEWDVKGDPPRVDFKKTIVLVVAAGSSELTVKPVLSDKGDLRLNIMATTDLTKDVGYVILTVSSEGVKTINGKKLVI
jgi:hypothetical protein